MLNQIQQSSSFLFSLIIFGNCLFETSLFLWYELFLAVIRISTSQELFVRVCFVSTGIGFHIVAEILFSWVFRIFWKSLYIDAKTWPRGRKIEFSKNSPNWLKFYYSWVFRRWEHEFERILLIFTTGRYHPTRCIPLKWLKNLYSLNQG
jgi:hypothetical protein